MAVIDTRNMISINEVAKRGFPAIVREAEAGTDQIVLRNNQAVAAVISIERLERLQELEDDLADILLAEARMATDSGERISLDEVLDMFGFTRDDFRDSE